MTYPALKEEYPMVLTVLKHNVHAGQNEGRSSSFLHSFLSSFLPFFLPSFHPSLLRLAWLTAGMLNNQPPEQSLEGLVFWASLGSTTKWLGKVKDNTFFFSEYEVRGYMLIL